MSERAETGREAATVYYDGSCPLCRREIAFVAKRDEGSLRFEDVSAADADLPPGLDRDSAMRRFHVRTPDGVVHGGAAGFVVMWRSVPALRPLARLFELPVIRSIREPLYRAFLAVRPAFQWIARRFERVAS